MYALCAEDVTNVTAALVYQVNTKPITKTPHAITLNIENAYMQHGKSQQRHI